MTWKDVLVVGQLVVDVLVIIASVVIMISVLRYAIRQRREEQYLKEMQDEFRGRKP